MKLIVDTEKMFKMTLSPEGQLGINVANSKQYQGQLTSEEMEQIAHRVSVITDGAIKFDPVPNDYIGMHKTDIETLEAQSEEINRLRGVIEKQSVELKDWQTNSETLNKVIDVSKETVDILQKTVSDTEALNTRQSEIIKEQSEVIQAQSLKIQELTAVTEVKAEPTEVAAAVEN